MYRCDFRYMQRCCMYLKSHRYTFFAGNDKDGYKYAIGQRKGDVRELVKQVNKELNGRGGGKPFFAQGSLKATRKQIEIFFEKKVNFQ